MTTIVADVKAALDPIFDGRVWRDSAAPDATLPYAVIYDGIDDDVLLSGDGASLARRRTIQVSLWQSITTETDTLIETVAGVLDGLRLDGRRLRLAVTSAVRLLEPADMPELVHWAITCRAAYLG